MRYAQTVKPILAISLLLFLAGCAGNPITIPSINAKDVNLEKGREISGSACGMQLLLLIPIAVNSRLETAYEQLKMQAGSDLIANVRIEESWNYAFVGTVYCSTLNATAYPKIK